MLFSLQDDAKADKTDTNQLRLKDWYTYRQIDEIDRWTDRQTD